MTIISRRTFLGTAAVVPFSVWYERVGFAQAVMTRFDATSPQGKAMLALYAKAATRMMGAGTPEASSSSWNYQWYTHAVRPDRTKAAEVTRVYPQPGGPRDLANEMWSTCQAHFQPQNEPFFLPWHRMYVYFFERIVRKMSGDATFTLPYWNYSTSDAQKHGVLPIEFRRPLDTALRSLYRANRNRPTTQSPQTPNVNNGEPIDKGAPGALSLAALKQGSYLPIGALQGFNQSIDFGLHGNVHVGIGASDNMGSVPWAARDPIFWAHHCNIDRLWASWNKNGGQNPGGAWLDRTFIFADENGTRVAAKVSDFRAVNLLNYQYDALEPAPVGFTPALIPEGVGLPQPTILSRGQTDLGTGPTRVVLQTAGALPESVATTRRTYLIVRDMRADAAPGVVYNVYLDLPENAAPASRPPHLAGTINFFGGVPHEGHEMGTTGSGGRFVSFDVTEVIRDLRARQLLRPQPSITIIPAGGAATNARATVGEIALAEQ